MGESRVGRVALMSIHPQYADRILDGTKRVEFRKRPVAADVTHVLVYATAPVSAVVGAFTVHDQHTASPQMLWRQFRQVAGISWSDFRDYYAGRSAGTGIAVGDVMHAPQPLCLRRDVGVQHPPQSFQYLRPDVAAGVLEHLRRDK